MIQHRSIADAMGVTMDDVDQLLIGRCNANLANRLGVTMADVEDFVRGAASANMARRLNVGPMSAADELAKTKGQEGAIGVIMGLLLADR